MLTSTGKWAECELSITYRLSQPKRLQEITKQKSIHEKKGTILAHVHIHIPKQRLDVLLSTYRTHITQLCSKFFWWW